MRALTVIPKQAGSLAVVDMPDPEPKDGELLVQGVALGVCGTDREIASGAYGWAPEGEERLIIGHESLGRVLQAPANSGFAEGDLVAGVVRRPDPVPCGACAHGEFDMCRNGQYTERGIKQRHGYASERWTVESDYVVKLDTGLDRLGVLMEPTTVVAKAWDQVEKIGSRSYYDPKKVLVTGAGPIGQLAALLGVQRGLEVHVLDRVTDGPKPASVKALGAHYTTESIDDVMSELVPDIVIEATGVGELVFGAMTNNHSYGLVCLTGVSPTGKPLKIEAGSINRELVLQNDAVFGSVNANLHHYALAAEALRKADNDWLAGLISRTVPLEQFADAFELQDSDVKVVLDLAAQG